MLGRRQNDLPCHDVFAEGAELAMIVWFIPPTVFLIVLIVARRRRAKRAESQAVSYMRVRHGHYWQPPTETAPQPADSPANQHPF
jgi:hypothetical protein